MKRSLLCFVVTLCAVSLVRADQGIRSLQQTLKDQGFYYGAVTGDKNAETTAAIRRYQIRNGLPVTGEINGETLRSVNPIRIPLRRRRNRLLNLPPFNPTLLVLMQAQA